MTKKNQVQKEPAVELKDGELGKAVGGAGGDNQGYFVADSFSFGVEQEVKESRKVFDGNQADFLTKKK